MKNFLTILLLSALALSAGADDALEGFLYGKAAMPDGTEWQSPEKLSMNKLQRRLNCRCLYISSRQHKTPALLCNAGSTIH